MRFTNFTNAGDRAENENKIIELYKELKNNINYALDNNLNNAVIKSCFEYFETELKIRDCIEK